MVNGAGCRQWRGALAARAMGFTDSASDVGLDAHIDACATCRTELDDLHTVALALGLADLERLHVGSAGPDLETRIVQRIAAESKAARRQRWFRAAAGTAAAVLLLAAVVVDVGRGDGRQVVLAAGKGAQGSAALLDRPWGTEVRLEVTGLDAEEVYWMWLSDADGERVAAGTMRGTDGEATAALASALPLDEARRIWMTDEDGEVVLDARIDPR